MVLERTVGTRRSLPIATPVAWKYDPVELKADGAIHVAGVALAAVGAAAIVTITLSVAPTVLFGAGVYALCLMATLTLSALYNMWPVSPRKWLLRRFDHAGIFLLIAGTYTPFALHLGAFGERFLVGVWCIAGLGMAFKLLLPGRFDKLTILFYLALGWSGLFLFREMAQDLDPAAVRLILFGGLVYTTGIVFHVWERLRFQNVIWHAFVLAGAACHYVAVLLTVLAIA